MARPRQARRVCFRPRVYYFKPVGVPLRQLEIADLTYEEGEALRLKHREKLSQTQAAQEMHTSQSTFQRILSSAYQKLATAVVEGHAIRFEE